ncbi:GSCOCG00008873001-RA-CDS, partial [Cotesia congregata]
MISSRVFLENTIEVLIHIDGMQIYKNSNIQVWPITVKIFNRNYTSHPFVAAIYCGDSKPPNVKEYLSDFVVECKNLINNGIVIDEKNYSFKIIAIVADSQARSYIKCCKAAGTFYACERCTVEGKRKEKKRVYPEMDCELRTRESFKKQTQKSHHKDGLKSLLRKLPNFDPVNSVILDSMHLLHLGVIKTLMDACGYSEQFQRKIFDTNDLARWKATQFRFVLLYCGPIVLQNILPTQVYKHFLLKFFFLLPSLYGKNSQTLNMHNLIHLPDDVFNLNLSLSESSAFWGENYIGKMKKLIKSPYKPLTQILNRLSELEHE